MTGTTSRTTTLLVSAAAIVVVVGGLRAAAHIVGPVMLALALTILFHPLRRHLEGRVPTWVSSLAVLSAAVVLVVGMSLTIGVAMARFAQLVSTYAQDLDDMVVDAASGLEALGVGKAQTAALTAEVDSVQLADIATSVLSNAVSWVSSLLLVVSLLIFFAFDAAQVRTLAKGARAHRPRLVEGLDSFARGTRSYFAVSAVFGLLVAVIDTGLLLALGVPGAFIWGVLAFVTNFIPNIGFIIGIVPPAIIALLEGGVDLMVVVIVLYSLFNVVIQSFIQPRYVGDAVGLSTSLTFLSLIFWTWVLGPVGALLSVPMSLLVRAVLVEADPAGRWRLPLISGRSDAAVVEPR